MADCSVSGEITGMNRWLDNLIAIMPAKAVKYNRCKSQELDGNRCFMSVTLEGKLRLFTGVFSHAS